MIVVVEVASPAQGLQMKPWVLFLFRVRPEQVLWYGWLQLEQVMGVMSRLIVLVHPRHTGPGFTLTSPALKRRDLRLLVGMEGVCSLRLPQHSLVNGLAGFECRHLAASRWTPREGPNSCPTDVVVDFVVDFDVNVVVAVVDVFYVNVDAVVVDVVVVIDVQLRFWEWFSDAVKLAVEGARVHHKDPWYRGRSGPLRRLGIWARGVQLIRPFPHRVDRSNFVLLCEVQPSAKTWVVPVSEPDWVTQYTFPRVFFLI